MPPNEKFLGMQSAGRLHLLVLSTWRLARPMLRSGSTLQTCPPWQAQEALLNAPRHQT